MWILGREKQHIRTSKHTRTTRTDVRDGRDRIVSVHVSASGGGHDDESTEERDHGLFGGEVRVVSV